LLIGIGATRGPLSFLARVSDLPMNMLESIERAWS
jgi:hypothetical protein